MSKEPPKSPSKAALFIESIEQAVIKSLYDFINRDDIAKDNVATNGLAGLASHSKNSNSPTNLTDSLIKQKRSATLSDSALFEKAQRRLNILICVIGAPASLLGWYLNQNQTHPDIINSFSNLGFAILCMGLLIWLKNGKSIGVAKHWGLWSCAVVVLMRCLFIPIIPLENLIFSLYDMYWLLIIVCIIGFLIFKYSSAILFTISSYIMGIALPWLAIAVFSISDTDLYFRLARTQLLCAFVLASLSILAWYRESFILTLEKAKIIAGMVNTDALTKLPNRHALYPMLENIVQSANRGESHVVVLLDIDHFKKINDTFGHNMGDSVLQKAAEIFRRQLRKDDILGRWGGEEFLIILPHSSIAESRQVAERLRTALQQQVFVNDEKQLGEVTASLGLSECQPQDSLTACIARADAALYRAKNSGRNCVIEYVAGMGGNEAESTANSSTTLKRQREAKTVGKDKREGNTPNASLEKMAAKAL